MRVLIALYLIIGIVMLALGFFATGPCPEKNTDIVSDVVARETAAEYLPGPIAPVFPGTYFGPTPLPEGNGRSCELVVDHVDTRLALRTVIETLQREASVGRHLLGGLGVRFAPKTDALLGMNIHPMNTYIEFPSLSTNETSTIHRAVWRSLREANVPFTCHWGQEYGMDPQSIRAYFGDRVDRWRAARTRLLPTPAARAANEGRAATFLHVVAVYPVD